MSAHPHTGRVYFIARDAYVKIGYTSQPIAYRLSTLKGKTRLTCPADTDFDAPLQVLHLIPGCIMRDEHRVQVLFAAHHVLGEWYALTPAFLRQLQLLDYVTDRETLANFRAARRELKKAHLQIVAAQ